MNPAASAAVTENEQKKATEMGMASTSTRGGGGLVLLTSSTTLRIPPLLRGRSFHFQPHPFTKFKFSSSSNTTNKQQTPNNPLLLALQHHLHSFRKFLRSSSSFSSLFHPISSLSPHLHHFLQQIHGSRVNFKQNHKFAAILPGGDSVAGLVVTNGILNFLNIYNTLLVVRLVLTWFPNSPPAIVSPLSTLCDPYLNIFRGIIPPLGGTLDLSPILAFLVLNAFTSTAAALPAELPSPSACAPPSQLTSSHHHKWLKRLSFNRDNRSNTSSL
ncbi:CCB3/YggT [Dillenia turbinata]|uniref:CCB3/YggT n=1 Tax=Dillenia turbinata TaxID=194707 RepID=A0AAN8Z9F1_9MAGN